jgi:hypothetical protein
MDTTMEQIVAPVDRVVTRSMQKENEKLEQKADSRQQINKDSTAEGTQGTQHVNNTFLEVLFSYKFGCFFYKVAI